MYSAYFYHMEQLQEYHGIIIDLENIGDFMNKVKEIYGSVKVEIYDNENYREIFFIRGNVE